MKRELPIATFIVLIGFVSAWSDTGRISIFSDSLYTSSEAFDSIPGLLTLYVVLEETSGGITAVGSIRVTGGGGFTGVWLSETSPFPVVVGTSQDSVSVGASGCAFPPPHLLLTIVYSVFGTSANCSYVEGTASAGYVPCVGLGPFPGGKWQAYCQPRQFLHSRPR